LACHSSKPFQQGANGKRRRKSTVLELPSHVHHSRHARTALGGEVEKNMSFLFGAGRGPNARNCGHSSRAGAVSMGPSGLDRSCSTIRSSARSHRIVGSQPDLPRRHHCRPAVLPFGLLARSPRPVWPHALARGGRSAHLAGLRSTQSPLPSQPDSSGRHPEQSQRAAPSRSCFFCGDRPRRGGAGSTQQMPRRRARIVGPCIRWQEGGGRQGAARC
jgi:hypothetical protein